MKLVVATCQIPTSEDSVTNFEHIRVQAEQAKALGADVAHFPEACLSGYAGIDFDSFDGFDWPSLQQHHQLLQQLAADLTMWLVVGSAHRLSGDNKPHNCLYIINPQGQLVDRYDKLFCAGDAESKTGDLAHYSSGNHFSVFYIGNIRCGALICHDYRYPELYREYKRRGVQLMFHSYHAGHINDEFLAFMRNQVGSENHQHNPANTIPGITQPAAMHSSAANNYMWISCPNSSAPNSCWPSFFIRPDGVITAQAQLHQPQVIIGEVDTSQSFYDSTIAWRERAMNGQYYSGELIKDGRSDKRDEW